MADVLRVTTPMINRAQVVDPKKGIEGIAQFNLQDTSKVNRTSAENDILMQHNGLFGEETTSALLLDLLKDPSVTVNYLKNIFLLQEVVKLLPNTNETITAEIEKMFEQLLLEPENLAEELERQEYSASKFRGELFAFLKDVIEKNPGNTELKKTVVDTLKSINVYTTKQDILNAVANSLEFLRDNLEPSKALAEKLDVLAKEFRAETAPEKFESLKEEVFTVLKEVEESILYNPKLDKVVSITKYNLSRFSTDTAYMKESIDRLFFSLRNEEDRQTLMTSVNKFLKENTPAQNGEEVKDKKSQVLDTLTKIISKQVTSKEIMLQSSDQLNKIIESLLSSPTNFTPLLHYVLPVQYQEMQAFMEIWVNPNGKEDTPEHKRGNEKDNIHMLMVFDIGAIGRFEMEMYVKDNVIDFFLFCPPAYTEAFAKTKDNMAKAIKTLDYQFGEVRIDNLERTRTLMEVFRSLPYKRTGVDVKA